MIKEFLAIREALAYGKEVVNKETWKKKQNIINSLTGLLASLLVIGCAFDYCFPVDQETINALATGIISVVSIFNIVATTVSSKHAGIKKK